MNVKDQKDVPLSEDFHHGNDNRGARSSSTCSAGRKSLSCRARKDLTTRSV